MASGGPFKLLNYLQLNRQTQRISRKKRSILSNLPHLLVIKMGSKGNKKSVCRLGDFYDSSVWSIFNFSILERVFYAIMVAWGKNGRQPKRMPKITDKLL